MSGTQIFLVILAVILAVYEGWKRWLERGSNDDA